MLALAAVHGDLASSAAAKTPPHAACPHNPVRFAVEPYDTGPTSRRRTRRWPPTSARSSAARSSCNISSSYVAEIETMKAGKLEMGEFGPLGYVLAHSIADAQPVAAFGDKNGKPDTYTAGIWVPKSSPITSLSSSPARRSRWTARHRPRAGCTRSRR